MKLRVKKPFHQYKRGDIIEMDDQIMIRRLKAAGLVSEIRNKDKNKSK
jgi:hypothetical protein